MIEIVTQLRVPGQSLCTGTLRRLPGSGIYCYVTRIDLEDKPITYIAQVIPDRQETGEGKLINPAWNWD